MAMERTHNDSFSFEIVEHLALISSKNDGWSKELNLVSWNGQQPPKFDIREWSPDHTKMGKGVTMYDNEMKKACQAYMKFCNARTVSEGRNNRNAAAEAGLRAGEEAARAQEAAHAHEEAVDASRSAYTHEEAADVSGSAYTHEEAADARGSTYTHEEAANASGISRADENADSQEGIVRVPEETASAHGEAEFAQSETENIPDGGTHAQDMAELNDAPF